MHVLKTYMHYLWVKCFLYSYVFAPGAVLYGTACKKGNHRHYACKKLIPFNPQNVNCNNFCIKRYLKVISLAYMHFRQKHAFLQHYTFNIHSSMTLVHCLTVMHVKQENLLNKTCQKYGFIELYQNKTNLLQF